MVTQADAFAADALTNHGGNTSGVARESQEPEGPNQQYNMRSSLILSLQWGHAMACRTCWPLTQPPPEV
jgi:hypothetical protein